jgi:hypothetical protein
MMLNGLFEPVPGAAAAPCAPGAPGATGTPGVPSAPTLSVWVVFATTEVVPVGVKSTRTGYDPSAPGAAIVAE